MPEGTGRLGRDAGRVPAGAAAAVVIAFTATPLLYMISLSLDPDPVGAPSWPPRISLINYEILASPDFAFFPAMLALAFFPGVIVLVTMRRQLAEIGWTPCPAPGSRPRQRWCSSRPGATTASSAGRWPPGCSCACRSPRCWPRC